MNKLIHFWTVNVNEQSFTFHYPIKPKKDNKDKLAYLIFPHQDWWRKGIIFPFIQNISESEPRSLNTLSNIELYFAFLQHSRKKHKKET